MRSRARARIVKNSSSFAKLGNSVEEPKEFSHASRVALSK